MYADAGASGGPIEPTGSVDGALEAAAAMASWWSGGSGGYCCALRERMLVELTGRLNVLPKESLYVTISGPFPLVVSGGS